MGTGPGTTPGVEASLSFVLVLGAALSLPMTVVDMHAPVLRPHPRPTHAAAQRGTMPASRMPASRMSAPGMLASRIALGVALASCTLTQEDFEPVVTDAAPAQPTVEPADEPGVELTPAESD